MEGISLSSLSTLGPPRQNQGAHWLWPNRTSSAPQFSFLQKRLPIPSPPPPPPRPATCVQVCMWGIQNSLL